MSMNLLLALAAEHKARTGHDIWTWNARIVPTPHLNCDPLGDMDETVTYDAGWGYSGRGLLRKNAPYLWNPFLSADADLQVLERSREVWAENDPDRMYRMIRRLGFLLDAPDASLGYAIGLRYNVGDYSRAVLAVLRSTDGEKP